jgi:16S rRNA processing protein RimM
MEIESCFKIGYIQKTHGLKGEVTISFDGLPDDIGSFPSVFVKVDGRLIPYFIETISIRGVKGFVKFEDVDSIDDAGILVRRSIFLPKSIRPKPGKDDFYDDEIIHFSVVDAEKGSLGKVTGIMQAGPNKLLVVDNDGKEVLVPVNSPFITNVNKQQKVVTVALPEGFLEL